MMCLRYTLYAPLSLAFNLFVMLTSPLWAAWAAIANLDRLPRPFHLVHTHDETIYGIHMAGPKPATVWGRWTRAMWWLCRNPGYGFDAYVLGVRAGDIHSVAATGELNEGRRTTIQLKNGGQRFGYRRDWVYRKGGTRYCKTWFGWSEYEQGGAHMLKFDINPFKRK